MFDNFAEVCLFFAFFSERSIHRRLVESWHFNLERGHVMRKTNNHYSNNALIVDVKGLQELLSGLGKQSCIAIGEKSGAIVRIGRRKLYNVRRIEEYLDSITEKEGNI